jgi:hypothetical protein
MVSAAGLGPAVLSLRAGGKRRGRAGSPGARTAQTVSIEARPDGIKRCRVPDHREGMAEHTALSLQTNIPGMTVLGCFQWLRPPDAPEQCRRFLLGVALVEAVAA